MIKTLKRNHALWQISLPSIFIPIILFISFDIIALGLNFWISSKLELGAVAINLSGRQRMLSQKMSKSLLMLSSAENALQKKSAFEEFTEAADLFNKTLNGFAFGGMTLCGNGKPIFLAQVKDQYSQFITAQSLQLWQIVYPNLKVVQDIGPLVDSKNIQAALDTLLHHNLQILKLMNDLTSSLERKATEDVAHLRLLQTSLLILALINFLLICKRLFRQIRLSQKNVQSLRDIIDSIDTGILLCDGNDIVKSANRAAQEIFAAYNSELVGKRFSQLIVSDEQRTVGVRLDNKTFNAKVDSRSLYELNEKVNLCTIVDISELASREHELSKLAFYDSLTGLPNRVMLKERLGYELLHAKRQSTCLALMFLDLDGFKAVNDNLGHDAGDMLLKQVAGRLQQSCRETDMVCRLGGDEFVIILTTLHSKLTAKQVADNILALISQAFFIQEKTVKVGVSIGIAIYPKDHNEADLLMKLADDAMFQAKMQGKNCYVFASNIAEQIDGSTKN